MPVPTARGPCSAGAAIGLTRTSSRVSSPAATRGGHDDRAERVAEHDGVRSRPSAPWNAREPRDVAVDVGRRQRVGHAEAGQVGDDHPHAGRWAATGSSPWWSPRKPCTATTVAWRRRPGRTPRSAWCGRDVDGAVHDGRRGHQRRYGDRTAVASRQSMETHSAAAALACPERALHGSADSRREHGDLHRPDPAARTDPRPAVVQALGVLRVHDPLVRRLERRRHR